MKIRRILAGALMTAVLLVIPALAARADEHDPARIKAQMAAQFDRPEQRLAVDPIVVADDHAIAGWTQGDMGGRALLRRHGHDWQIVLCSGDQIKSAEALAKIGLSADAARTLAAKLAEAEGKVSKERLAQFARFDGIVMMDAAGHHPPQHKDH